MDKKIALQLTGHLRTYEDTFPSLQKNVILPLQGCGYQVDIFLHTWNQTDHNEAVHHNPSGEIRSRDVDDSVISNISNLYKPKGFEISPPLPNLDNNYTLFKLNGNLCTYQTALSVFYTKFKANELRIKSNEDYDWVISSRFDIQYLTPFKFDSYIQWFDKESIFDSNLDINEIYFFSSHQRVSNINLPQFLSASDIFYFGKPKALDKISRLYTSIKQSPPGTQIVSFEYMLYDHARKQELEAIEIDYKIHTNWSILRSDTKKPGMFKRLKNTLQNIITQ